MYGQLSAFAAVSVALCVSLSSTTCMRLSFTQRVAKSMQTLSSVSCRGVRHTYQCERATQHDAFPCALLSSAACATACLLLSLCALMSAGLNVSLFECLWLPVSFCLFAVLFAFDGRCAVASVSPFSSLLLSPLLVVCVCF